MQSALDREYEHILREADRGTFEEVRWERLAEHGTPGQKNYPHPVGRVQPGHTPGTLTEFGDETGQHVPTVGEPFIVYRFGRQNGALVNRNAGNAEAVAAYIARTQDFESPKERGIENSTHVTAHRVTITDGFHEYDAIVQGKRKRGLRQTEELPPATNVGRTAGTSTIGSQVAYSFPEGGAWKSEVVASIPLEEFHKALGTSQSGGLKDFDLAPYADGVAAIRRVFGKLL